MTQNVPSASAIYPAVHPVTWLFVEIDRNEAHVRVNVFIGRQPGSRGRAGELVLRTDEWDELRGRLRSLDFVSFGKLGA